MKTIDRADTGPAGPEVLRLADLVAYQPGSVVSRQLVRKATGGVTLFAFAAGQGLSEHTAPFDALVHVLEGEADVSVAARRFRVRAGEAIVLPANVPHALDAATPFKMALTMIRSEA